MKKHFPFFSAGWLRVGCLIWFSLWSCHLNVKCQLPGTSRNCIDYFSVTLSPASLTACKCHCVSLNVNNKCYDWCSRKAIEVQPLSCLGHCSHSRPSTPHIALIRPVLTQHCVNPRNCSMCPGGLLSCGTWGLIDNLNFIYIFIYLFLFLLWMHKFMEGSPLLLWSRECNLSHKMLHSDEMWTKNIK